VLTDFQPVNTLGDLGVRARLLNSRTETRVSQRDAVFIAARGIDNLAGRGRHRGRQSSCAAADRKRWTSWRSLRSLRVALLVRTFPSRTEVPSYADFFWAAFTFAHLCRWAAAIFFRAAADIVLFFGMLTTFCFCLAVPRTFAHRALCAAAILSLAAADKRLRVPVFLPYEAPLRAASAASRRSTVLTA